MSGLLYVVATPIGNLSDISQRALDVLNSVDFILCEDTRQTAKLLARYEISKPLFSLREHNEKEKSPLVVGRISAGESAALVSDAGAPLVRDPGAGLVTAAKKAGIKVVPIPGASAVIAALCASGFNLESGFYFAGFMPEKKKAREETAAKMKALGEVCALFVPPHDAKKTLAFLAESLGPLNACLCRELTKLHEETIEGTLPQLAELARAKEFKGEITLVIDKPEDCGRTAAAEEEIDAAAAEIMKEIDADKIGAKNASKIIASRLKISGKQAYEAVLRAKKNSGRSRGFDSSQI